MPFSVQLLAFSCRFPHHIEWNRNRFYNQLINNLCWFRHHHGRAVSSYYEINAPVWSKWFGSEFWYWSMTRRVKVCFLPHNFCKLAPSQSLQCLLSANDFRLHTPLLILWRLFLPVVIKCSSWMHVSCAPWRNISLHRQTRWKIWRVACRLQWLQLFLAPSVCVRCKACKCANMLILGKTETTANFKPKTKWKYPLRFLNRVICASNALQVRKLTVYGFHKTSLPSLHAIFCSNICDDSWKFTLRRLNNTVTSYLRATLPSWQKYSWRATAAEILLLDYSRNMI